MELFRFQEDKTANIQKVKLQNNLYKVSDTEAYKVDPTSVGYIWRSRFFGFGKPKRKPIVTVRVNDGTTLHPPKCFFCLYPLRMHSDAIVYNRSLGYP